jgi:hypothetical protein
MDHARRSIGMVALRVLLGAYVFVPLVLVWLWLALAPDYARLRALPVAIVHMGDVLPQVLALLLLVPARTAGAALDVAIGAAAAALLGRVYTSTGFLLSLYAVHGWTVLVPPGLFTLADLAILVTAVMVRRRLDTGHLGRLAAAILGCLAWEWLFVAAADRLF